MTITKSGALASFYTVNKAPIKHLRVYFSPKQAGSGTASPENIRPIEGRSNLYTDYTGQNLLPSGTFAVTRRGIDYYYSTDGFIRIQGYDAGYTFLSLPSDYQFYIPAGTYTLSCNTSSGITVYMLLDGNDIEFKIGNGKTSITKTIPSGIAKLQVAAYTTVDTTIYPQLEVGSTASSFKKPMIHRPQIIQFPPQTKNLFNPNWDMLNYASTYTINSDGSITQKQSDGRGWTQSNFSPVHLEAGTYTLTCSDGNTFNVGTSIDNFATQTRLPNGGGTFTLTQDADVRIKHSAPSYPTTYTVQLEKGSSATAYVPYMDTIYGGYVDLITGELVAQYGFFSTTWGAGLNNTVLGNNERRGFYSSSIIFDTSSNLHADGQGPYQAVKTTMCNAAFWGWNYNSDTTHYYINEHDINVMLPVGTDNNLILNFCAKLKNPQTVATLTPTELQTFLGRNNIWSNADRIEVEYDLAESNDELYRRRNIILQGAPHLETATGNIANFKTDLIAPIKEAKVYFEPKQLGSGDPSPNNVREIVGQNSVEITQAGLNLVDLTTLPGSYSKTDLTCTIDSNTISLTANLNQSTFGQYTAIWHLPPALLGKEVYIGCTEVVHPESEYFSTVVCEFRDSENTFISDPTVITTKTNLLGKKIQIPANAERVEFYFRIAQNGRTVGIPQGDTVVYKNFYVRWPANSGGYEAYNGQIIPITFPAVGKNLLNTSESNSEMTYMGWYYDVGLKLEAGTYTLSIRNAFKNDYHGVGLLVNSEKNSILTIANSYSFGGQADLNSRTFTITQEQAEQIAYFRVHFTKAGAVYSDVSESNLQIEKGSSATSYEPYNNTIYGGYIDLINGEIVAEWRKVYLKDLNWANYSGKVHWYTNVKTNSNVISYTRECESYIYSDTLTPLTNGNFLNEQVGEFTYYGPVNSSHTQAENYKSNIWTRTPEVMENGDAANNWIKTTYPNASLVYKLAYPIHYPLTPQTLKTLKATNNIWSSANGPVSIKYWTH